MSVGPTEEGSIVAHVQADITNLQENITRAEAKVEELTGRKPEITVKANVDEALTKLAAVEAASDRVSAAKVRLSNAMYVLDKAQTEETRSASLMVDAQTESTRALKDAKQAVADLTLAQEMLRKEEEKAAGGKPAPTAAPATGAPAGFAAVAGIAVLTLLPVVAALAGYVAAVTGAFAGMGAAGVLAVLGIKNAIANGTAAGNMFSSGLHVLKGDLDQLSATSANAMLGSFQRALDLIHTEMPSLNHEIGVFSGMLGTTGDIVLSALISGFQTLLPLFTQAGV
ncbi:MAG: hypothetical protein B7X07_06355, partial [Actinobacteria bacterium 21-64-8]